MLEIQTALKIYGDLSRPILPKKAEPSRSEIVLAHAGYGHSRAKDARRSQEIQSA